MKQFIKLRLSSILLLDVLNLIFEDSPELAVLDSFYLLNSRALQSQLELDLYIFPLLTQLRDFEDDEVIVSLNQVDDFFPMIRELVGLDLVHNLGDLQLNLVVLEAGDLHEIVLDSDVKKILVRGILSLEVGLDILKQMI